MVPMPSGPSLLHTASHSPLETFMAREREVTGRGSEAWMAQPRCPDSWRPEQVLVGSRADARLRAALHGRA
eukprot:8924526-Pyramimonas_sp.AAC.1